MKWRQREKEAWLVHGYKNSKYFHACASQRRQTNQIFSIMGKNDNLCEDLAEVDGAFVDFFQEL